MPIEISKEQYWDIYWNTAFTPADCFAQDGSKVAYCRYKLHISINPRQFMEIYEALHALLYKALEKLVISDYKFYALYRLVEQEIDERQEQIPFVIYLYENPTEKQFADLMELLKEIQALLDANKIEKGDLTKVSACDLELLGSFIFRQTAIKTTPPYEYLDAYDPKNVARLKEAGLQSDYYKKLLEHMKMWSRPAVQSSDALVLKSLAAVDVKHADQAPLTTVNADKSVIAAAAILMAAGIAAAIMPIATQILMPKPREAANETVEIDDQVEVLSLSM